MRIISTLLIVVIPIICFSQSGFKAGFIVKNTGDTIRGNLKEDVESNLQKGVVFKQSNSDAEKMLNVDDIKAFGFDGGNIFEKISYSNPPDNSWHGHFAKLMVKGYYALFSFFKSDRQYYVVETQEDSTYLLHDANYTTSGAINEESNYKNMLLFLSRNCNEQKKKLENISFTDKEIMDYLISLNKCLAPSSVNDVVYKKEKSKMNIYAYAGGIAFSSNYELTARVIARFTQPGVSKKTSLNIGFNYMKQSKTKDMDKYSQVFYGYKPQSITNIDLFSVPFFIQYYITNGFIRPYVSGGLSIDYRKETFDEKYSGPTSENKMSGGPIASAGLDGNITRNFAIKAEWMLQYTFGYGSIQHYPTIGVAVSF